MQKLLLICAICAVSLGKAAVAADVFDGSRPRLFSLADPLELDATIGGYPVWQGEKKWRIFDIIGRNSTGSAAAQPMGDLRLFQTEGKKLIAVMTVSANLAQGLASDWTDEPCKREDLLFKASIGGKFSNVNCATINHITNFPGNPSGKGAELFNLLKDQGVEIPPTVLQLTFTRYSSNLRWLSFAISVNPETAGFQRADEPQWGRNPWHRSQALNNPEKKRFIDALGAWALQFARQMDAAFEKKGDAFASVPSWRSAIGSQPLPEPVKEPVKPKVTLE